MDVFPGSTIAALCYARDTSFDFHTLATELSKAVWDAEGAGRLDMPDPDFALCDTPEMRIGLARVAMQREFPGSLTGKHYPACLLLSVGPGETMPDRSKQARYRRTHGELIGRIQDIAAADRVLMFERAGPVDSEVLDAVIDDTRHHLDQVLKPRREPVSDEIRPAPASAPQAPEAEPARDTAAPSHRAAAVPEPDEIIQGLARRVDAELARLDQARSAFEVAEAAADRRAHQTQGLRLVVPRLFPGMPTASLSLLRARGKSRPAPYPDYEHMPANVDERPLLHRAAVNALNVTVMAIALPVGAALLTMAVLGREDMLFSSRVTAVTGVGVGLYNTGAADRLLSLFS